MLPNVHALWEKNRLSLSAMNKWDLLTQRVKRRFTREQNTGLPGAELMVFSIGRETPSFCHFTYVRVPGAQNTDLPDGKNTGSAFKQCKPQSYSFACLVSKAQECCKGCHGDSVLNLGPLDRGTIHLYGPDGIDRRKKRSRVSFAKIAIFEILKCTKTAK